MEWTVDLAYVIGLITTDGSLSKDGRHMSLVSKDLEQIETFAKILHLTNKVECYKSTYITSHPQYDNAYYRIQFGNVKFYRWLLSIGLMPNKSKILGAIVLPDEFFADLIRGELDGDGCTYSYWDKRWRSSFMLYTEFCSASKAHLEWIRDKINLFYHIEGKITFAGKSTFLLRYAKKSSIVLLGKLYYKKTFLLFQEKGLKLSSN